MSSFMRCAFLFLLALGLGGCFSSSYDISAQVSPVFPVKEGKYANDKGEIKLVKKGGLYQQFEEKDGKLAHTSNMRFFNVPESSLYILQVQSVESTKGKDSSYSYIFASVASGGSPFTLRYVSDEEVKKLPPYLASLIDGNLRITNGPRDTFYFLREVLRREVPLSEGDDYKRVP